MRRDERRYASTIALADMSTAEILQNPTDTVSTEDERAECYT